MSNSKAYRYCQWIIKHRFKVLFSTLFFVLFSAQGLQYFRFNGQYRIFFGEDNPQLLAFDTIQKTYTKDDNILLVLEFEDNNVFTPQNLKIINLPKIKGISITLRFINVILNISKI